MINELNQHPQSSQEQTETIISPPTPTFGSNNTIVSLNTLQDALKSIHSAGSWAIVLGLLNIVLTPLFEFATYTQASSSGYTKSTLVLGSFVIGLVVGSLFVGLGIKLKRITENKINRADKILLWLAAVVLLVVILSLIDGERGVGLINFLTLFAIAQARDKIRKLKKEGVI